MTSSFWRCFVKIFPGLIADLPIYHNEFFLLSGDFGADSDDDDEGGDSSSSDDEGDDSDEGDDEVLQTAMGLYFNAQNQILFFKFFSFFFKLTTLC